LNYSFVSDDGKTESGENAHVGDNASERNQILDGGEILQPLSPKAFNTNFLMFVFIFALTIWVIALTINASVIATSLRIAYGKIEAEKRFWKDETVITQLNELQEQINNLKIQSQLGTDGQDILIGGSGQDIRIGSGTTENIRISSNNILVQGYSTIQISEVTETDARVWSQPTLDILVGTTVTWTWTSYENVVQSNEAYVAMTNPIFTSGELQKGGSYSLLFEETGVFYFMSENSLTLRTKVTVTGFSIKSGSVSVPQSLSVGKSLLVAGTPIVPIRSFCVERTNTSKNCCPVQSTYSDSFDPNFGFMVSEIDYNNCIGYTKTWTHDQGCNNWGSYTFSAGFGCCYSLNKNVNLRFRICH